MPEASNLIPGGGQMLKHRCKSQTRNALVAANRLVVALTVAIVVNPVVLAITVIIAVTTRESRNKVN